MPTAKRRRARRIGASLNQKTNDALCKAIISKGTSFPALDRDGQPMASYWTVAPSFLMPPFGRR